MLEWLAEAERHLRYQGQPPTDMDILFGQLEQHMKFQDDLEEQEIRLHECLDLGNDILKQCHPDAITTVKHWLTILQARWEEVSFHWWYMYLYLTMRLVMRTM